MAVDTSININLMQQVPQIRVINVLKIFTDVGWEIIHNQSINYLAIGDKDCSNWEIKNNINAAEIMKICVEKESALETIGFMMTWKKTLIGGEFLFWPDKNYKSFSVCLSSDRQAINLTSDYKITDFQWYLEKLLPPLNDAFGVEYFSCEEHI